MGRSAKRKKHGQAITSPPPKPEQFVDNLQHRGYDYRDIQRSPDLPDTRRQPEV